MRRSRSLKQSVEFVRAYIDYKSPFSYLAFDPLVGLEAKFGGRVKVGFLPLAFSVQDGFGLPGERSAVQEAKVRYAYLDCRRFANERGLKVLGPQKAFDSTLALAGGLLASDAGAEPFQAYSREVFERFFSRELDLEDPAAITDLLERHVGAGPPDIEQFAAGDGGERLRRIREEALDKLVFGVPTVLVRNEPFFGYDRIGQVVRRLEGLRGLSGVSGGSE